MSVSKFCSDCNGWSCFGVKFIPKNSVHRHFSMKNICEQCYPKWKEKYEAILNERELVRKAEKKVENGLLRLENKYKSTADFPETKECSKCNLIKPSKDFYYFKYVTAIGIEIFNLYGYCKICHYKQMAQVYEKHKANGINYCALYYAANKEKWRQYNKNYVLKTGRDIINNYSLLHYYAKKNETQE